MIKLHECTYYCFNKELFDTLKDQKLINVGPKSILEARVNGAGFLFIK